MVVRINMNKKRKPGRTVPEDIIRDRCNKLGLIYVRKFIDKNRTQVCYLCQKHIDKGEIVSAWTHIRTGKYGCPYCSGKYKTTDDFKREVLSIIPDVVIVGEYKNARTKVHTKCINCGHEWHPEARSLLYGQGCPMCARKKKSLLALKTQEQFESDLHSVNPNIVVVGTYAGTHKKIECRCVIHGVEWYSYPANLLNRSAGCPRCAIERFNNTPSSGERKIMDWLDVNKINYVSECSLRGCAYKRPLRFDFYLPDYNIAIEYDGEQHFRPIGWYADDMDSFLNTQKRDSIKDEYCKDNGIDLIRIPYTEYENIDNILNFKIKEGVQPY